MTDRSSSSGGITGATGDLTPDEIPDELVPAERREIEDPARQAAVTAAQAGSPPEVDAPPPPGDDDEPAPQTESRTGGDEVSGEEERF
jgi:hypothetical protein